MITWIGLVLVGAGLLALVLLARSDEAERLRDEQDTAPEPPPTLTWDEVDKQIDALDRRTDRFVEEMAQLTERIKTGGAP